MTNVLFLYDNLIDVGSVYGTSENADLPAINVQHRFRTKVWEVGSAVADMVIDFGAVRSVTAVALCDHDWLAAPNSLMLEFATSSFSPASGQSQALTFAINPASSGNKTSIIQTFTLNSCYQYARLRVHANSIWQVGRIFLGTYFEPDLNVLHGGFGIKHMDDSKVSNTVSGQEHVDVIEKYRTVAMKYVARTQADLDEFITMWNAVGSNKDFFMALDYDNYPAEQTMYGKFSRDMNTNWPDAGKRGVTLAFSESR